MGFTFSLKMVSTKILVPGSWYQDLGTKILVPGSWYQDLGNRISDQDPGTKTFVPRSLVPKYQDLGPRSSVLRSLYQDLGTQILVP